MVEVNIFDILAKVINLRLVVSQKGSTMYKNWVGENKSYSRERYGYEIMNMAMYLAYRSEDTSLLQEELRMLGVSSFVGIESDVMNSLNSIIDVLSKLSNIDPKIPLQTAFGNRSINLNSNTEEVFGRCPNGRNTRIMVTLPTEAGDDYNIIYDLIDNGMSIARINCAHDNMDIWLKMINNIKHASDYLSKNCKISMELAGPKIRIDWVYSTMKKPMLYPNDTFILTPERIIDEEEKLVIGCNLKEIFDCIKIGDPVLIDDGVIEGRITGRKGNGYIVHVSKVHPKKNKVRAEKGLNFPESNIDISILTDKDKEDLKFICQHADIIGCSFVKTRQDIIELQEAIRENTSTFIPMMLKVETVKGVQNLSELIVEGSKHTPISVMIARGDLAIEGGFMNLGRYQHEIMDICESASVPVVWATQVLEGMCKSNIPTRAEITDVYEGGSRAEVIMLNKGKYLTETVDFLDKILIDAQDKHYKRSELHKKIINI